MQDAYLDGRITQDHIDTATNYIEAVYSQITDNYHKQRLIDLQVYQLVCLDNQIDSEDIFGTKFEQYKELFKEALKNALDAIKTDSGLSTLSVTLERA